MAIVEELERQYEKKTTEELLYIVKDASEALNAMFSHDTIATKKYITQIVVACFVLIKRA